MFRKRTAKLFFIWCAPLKNNNKKGRLSWEEWILPSLKIKFIFWKFIVIKI